MEVVGTEDDESGYEDMRPLTESSESEYDAAGRGRAKYDSESSDDEDLRNKVLRSLEFGCKSPSPATKTKTTATTTRHGHSPQAQAMQAYRIRETPPETPDTDEIGTAQDTAVGRVEM